MRRAQHAKEQRGLTLVELLLVVMILGLLLGAMVSTSSSSRLPAEHAEGVRRFESLLRFARAEAQQSGRSLRLEIRRGEGPPGGESTPAQDDVTPRLLWEPDPIGAPGQFEPLPSTQSWVDEFASVLEVEQVRLLDAEKEPRSPARKLTRDDETAYWTAEQSIPSVLFFADGSSDSAEFTLVSHDGTRSHRTLVRLVGITGFITREAIEEPFITRETIERPRSFDPLPSDTGTPDPGTGVANESAGSPR